MTTDIEKQIREEVRKLLENGTVDLFIGYEDVGQPLRVAPAVIRKPEDAERLVWNRCCTANLAAYLVQFFRKPVNVRGEWSPPKIGILAKEVDSRSIAGLIQAHQVIRDNLHILGVYSLAMIDRHKAAAALGEIIATAEVDEKEVRLTGVSGARKTVPIAELLMEGGGECPSCAPVIHDKLIGEPPPLEKLPSRFQRIIEFENKPIEERWRIFSDEMSRCIRCYACRQACPNCYCLECFAEETSPAWTGVTTDLPDVMFFQLGRILHQAGRCVDCGACAAACPQGIDLRLFTAKTLKDSEELFRSEAFRDPEQMEALCLYSADDDESFMTQP